MSRRKTVVAVIEDEPKKTNPKYNPFVERAIWPANRAAKARGEEPPFATPIALADLIDGGPRRFVETYPTGACVIGEEGRVLVVWTEPADE